MAMHRDTSVHEAASSGFTSSASTYVAGRPAYAIEALLLLSGLFSSSTRPVADIGAGAGMMSALLDQHGVSVVAVEPLAAMIGKVPHVLRPVRAVAQDLPIATASLSGAVAAQSFHWFATPQAVDELARVIMPGGALALVWNERDANVGWVAQYDEIVDRFAGDTPRFMNLSWKSAFSESGAILEESYVEFANPAPSSRAGVVARALSTSFIAALDEDVRRRVATEIEEVTANLPDQFDFPYLTRVWIYRRSS